MNKTKIQIYTGDGKGKTTAALGLIMRALGNGLKTGIIFFDKGGDYYGEKIILEELKNKGLIYKFFGEPRMNNKSGFRFKNNIQDLQNAQLALDEALLWMKRDLDLLILDEINTTIKNKLLRIPDLIHLIKQKPENIELVLTGRYCPPEILIYGDLITEMKSIKHYISRGQTARPGIEY